LHVFSFAAPFNLYIAPLVMSVQMLAIVVIFGGRIKGEDVGFLAKSKWKKGASVIGLMAAILTAMHMQRADDQFGMPNGTPITDRVIEASIQWAERIMQRIDSLHSK
jgi:hypothetical protein